MRKKKERKSFIEWLKGLFTRIDNIIEELGDPVYLITSKFYEGLQSPTLDILVALTKTDVDDKILAFLRANLPRVIEQLGAINDLEGENDDNIIIAFLEHLRDKKKPYVDALIWKVGSMLIEKLKDFLTNEPEIKEQSSDTIMQLTWEANREEEK